jgi:hypothetical protein
MDSLVSIEVAMRLKATLPIGIGCRKQRQAAPRAGPSALVMRWMRDDPCVRKIFSSSLKPGFGSELEGAKRRGSRVTPVREEEEEEDA